MWDQFLNEVRQRLPFRIHVVQTDNGAEFQSQFHRHAEAFDIKHVYIRPRTQRLNAFGALREGRSRLMPRMVRSNSPKPRLLAAIRTLLDRWEAALPLDPLTECGFFARPVVDMDDAAEGPGSAR